LKISQIAIVCFTLSSCSLFESRGPIGEDGKGAKGKKTSVTVAEYEALQKKYNNLNKKYQMLAAAEAIKEDDASLEDEVLDESMDLKKKLQMANNSEDIKIKGAPKPMSAATMNSLKTAKAQKSSDIVIRREEPLNEAEIENEISVLRKANMLIGKNRFNEALSKLKSIEKSKSKQIQIRAKFLMGDILYKQNEYDLAMQIFEEIIMKDSFSGVVIKTLGRLIACSNKLKLKQKEEQYSSILYDFFES
jgi:TolA-binding protein